MSILTSNFEVVFVTNSGHLAQSDLAWILARAARVVIRRNVGHDFGAWRDALSVCGLPQQDTKLLLIANDSVYGPIHPLENFLSKVDFSKADVWAVTDSWQHSFHLQSYLVAFGTSALSSPGFASFWNSVRDVRSKWWVVHRYEIGLTRALMAAGLRCKAVWPYTWLIDLERESSLQDDCASIESGPDCSGKALDDLSRKRDPFLEAKQRNRNRILGAALRRVPLNPTADMWQVLIERGCPFIKRELLQKNPAKVEGVAAWESVVRPISTFDPDIILRDLERTLKNQSP
jgi:hypothetical protein